jgi:hypothetical protein
MKKVATDQITEQIESSSRALKFVPLTTDQ